MTAWTGAMGYSRDFIKDTLAKRKYHENLSRLKMYKIASWHHRYNNQYWDRYAILAVPYAENTKWDTIYFMVKERSVKELLGNPGK